MSDIKSSGSTSSAIKVAVDIETQIGGKSTIRLGDGTEISGPTRQSFVRISPEVKDGFPANITEGDWLINPATKETHRVISVAIGVVGMIVIRTKSGDFPVRLDEIAETLLLVVNE